MDIFDDAILPKALTCAQQSDILGLSLELTYSCATSAEDLGGDSAAQFQI